MEDKNKHNIFSKEEFFKAIDEKRSLGADADDFDKEAMEGLAMVKDRQKLEKLDAAIDDIVHRESAKAGRKKNIYYFAAAASLALIVGIFFLVKENSFKEGKNLAQSAPETTEQAVKGFDFPPPPAAQKAAEPDADKSVPAKETPELKGKEEAFKEGKLAESTTQRNLTNGISTVNVPVESENSVAANEKSIDNGWTKSEGAVAGGKMQDTKSTGKSTVDEVSAVDQETYSGLASKRANKPEEKKAAHKKSEEATKNLEDATALYKDADEKEKKRYETNTLWSTAPSANGPGAQKQQQAQTEYKPKTAGDDQVVTGSTTTASAPAQTQVAQGDFSKADKNNNGDMAASGEQQLNEVAVTKTNKKRSGGNRSKAKSPASEPSPSREESKDVAGYAFYSQTSTRDFRSPEFIGGTAALQQFISDNLEVSAPEKKGAVSVEFTVKPDGAVDTTNVKVTQPIKGCDPCTKDVKNLVKKMPKWQPALENGKGKEYRQKMSVPYNTKATKK